MSAGGGGRWWAQLPDVWKSWRGKTSICPLSFPANFMLVGAMNPSRQGYTQHKPITSSPTPKNAS
jgi:hypothetical protein